MGVDWQAIEQELGELEVQLADPTVSSDPAALAKLAKRQKEIEQLLELRNAISQSEKRITGAESVVAGDDASLRELAEQELTGERAKLGKLTQELQALTHPRDPDDVRPAIVEIRAGAGGDEASLFAKELYGMYARFAEDSGNQLELLSSSRSEAGGFKEVVFRVAGDNAFGKLRYEGGTHRVQRIPVTESGGRIHTSTATVAVLPEVEERELEIKPDEVRLDVFRSSGPGGQSVNTTDSAVRVTHLPTGITVSCQDEKSQHKNRAKAMQILRARIKAQQETAAAAERGDARRAQVGTGDRSEKIRTYNVPQDRVTDHRIKRSFSNLKGILNGDLGPVIAAIQEAVDADRE